VKGYKSDTIDLGRLQIVASRMEREHRAFHESRIRRRQHYYNDPTVDPVLVGNEGNKPDPDSPFAQVPRVQSDRIRSKVNKLVSRITENPWQLEVVPPDQTQALEKTANSVMQVLTSWGLDIEDRRGVSLLHEMAYSVLIDGIAFVHVRRCADLWPEMGWLADDGPARLEEYDEEEECSGCGGTGGEDGDCPQCGGTGMYQRGKVRIRSKPGEAKTQLYREYAQRGAPWTWEVLDTLQVCWEEDADPRGGLYRALVSFEVRREDYDGDDAADYRTSERLPGQTLGDMAHATPSSGEFSEGERVRVRQLWTRTHYYEWLDNDPESVKSGEHGYMGVPIYMVAPRDTRNRDKVYRFESEVEGMFRVKEYADWMHTTYFAVVQNQSNPLTREVAPDPDKSPLLAPDGGFTEDREGTAAARYTSGGELQILSQPMSAAIPQALQFFDELMTRAEPDDGSVDVGSATSPWTVRLGQQQANVAVAHNIRHMEKAVQWAFNRILDDHVERGDMLIAFGRESEGERPKRGAPISIQAKEVEFFDVRAFVNPVSAAERITTLEHLRGLLAEGLIEAVDFYEAMGELDPADKALRVKLENISKPYVDAAIAAKLAERMGSVFLLGPAMEMLNSQGQGVSPMDVLGAKGYNVQQQPQGMPGQPQQGGPPMNGQMLSQVRQQTQMPDLQALSQNGPSSVGMPG